MWEMNHKESWKWQWSRSAISDSLWPHGLYSSWNSPARVLEWVAVPFSRGSSQPRDGTQVSHIAGRFFTSSAIREAHKESWPPKNWCFWIVMLEKTLESPFDSKESKPVNPKGNQPWIFIERTDAEAEILILWPPDAKNWLVWKDTNAGKDRRQEEKGTTEDEMVGWHQWLNRH